MKRVLLGCLTVWCVVGPAGVSRAEEVEVYYQNPDTGKEVTVDGTLVDEGPAGVKVKTKKAGTKVIPPLEANLVMYKGELAGTTVSFIDYRKPYTGFEAKALATKVVKLRMEYLDQALTRYQGLDDQLRGKDRSHRFLRYKIAHVMALQAEADPARVDAARVDAAIEALSKYKTEFSGGWEVVPALRELARLQEQKGDVEGAAKTYDDLAAVPDIPRAMGQESRLLVARLLIRAGKYGDAESKLKAMQRTLPPKDPERAKIDVYLAQSQLAQGHAAAIEAPVKAALSGSPDPGLRALAHNLLGDYYRSRKQPKEALWEYLKVDTLYPQDPEEHAKALYWLSKLFEDVRGDRSRSESCLEKLKDKRYAGTMFQRKAMEEGMGTKAGKK